MPHYALRSPTSVAAITVGVASTLVLAASATRSHAVIQSATTNTGTIFLGFGSDAVDGSGFELAPGQAFEIDRDWYTSDAIYAISDTAAQTVRVTHG